MSIVHCPRCRDEVTVPAKAPAKALVRCPLCLEEYLLSEALAQMPPALLIVGGEVEEEEALVGATVAEAESAGEYRMAGGAFGETLDSSMPASAMVSAPRPGVKAGPRARRKERSALGEVIKIVMGGVVGITLGIVGIWWIARTDPFNIGPKVAPYAPWLVPAQFHKQVGEPGATAANTTNSASTAASTSNGTEGAATLNVPPSADGSFAGHPNAQVAANSGQPSKGKAKSDDEPLQLLPEPFGTPTSSEPVLPASIDLPALEPAPTTPESNPTAEPSVEPPDPAAGSKGKAKSKGNSKSNGKAAAPAHGAPDVDLTPLLPDGDTPPASETNPSPSPRPEPAPESTAPLASAADLAAAVATANEALAKVETATSNNEPKEVRQQLFTELYAAVADGGSVLSHLDPADADAAEPLANLKQLLDNLAKQPGKLSAFGHLGRTNLAERKAGEGFAFAGKVIEYKAAGSVFESTLDAGNGVTVQLVSLGNPQDFCEVGDQILAAGRIVEEPQKNIRGYEGEAERVVLLGHAALAPPPMTESQ